MHVAWPQLNFSLAFFIWNVDTVYSTDGRCYAWKDYFIFKCNLFTIKSPHLQYIGPYSVVAIHAACTVLRCG